MIIDVSSIGIKFKNFIQAGCRDKGSHQILPKAHHSAQTGTLFRNNFRIACAFFHYLWFLNDPKWFDMNCFTPQYIVLSCHAALVVSQLQFYIYPISRNKSIARLLPEHDFLDSFIERMRNLISNFDKFYCSQASNNQSGVLVTFLGFNHLQSLHFVCLFFLLFFSPWSPFWTEVHGATVKFYLPFHSRNLRLSNGRKILTRIWQHFLYLLGM